MLVGLPRAVWVNADPAQDPPTFEYHYDPHGNRIQTRHRSQAGDAVWNGTYDAQDRLVSYECVSGPPCSSADFDFDYRDNLSLWTKTDQQSGDVTEYVYDAWGDLEQVLVPEGGIYYQLDPEGRRIFKEDARNVQDPRPATGWVWSNDDRILAEVDASGAVAARFYYATKGHVPDLMYHKNQWYRLITDWRGSVRLVVDQEGKIVHRMDYSPFGRVLNEWGDRTHPFGFAGGLYDPATGLVRFGARDYDPLVGRWTNKDPIRFSGGDINLYGYVMQDPVNFVDPSGLAPSAPKNSGTTVTPQSDGPGWKTMHAAACLYLAMVCKNSGSASPCFSMCFPMCMSGNLPSWDPTLCPLGDGDNPSKNSCNLPTE